MFNEKEIQAVLRALAIAVYQLERLPADLRSDLNHIRDVLTRFSSRNSSIYVLQASLLFDPPKSAEEAFARYGDYGVLTTLDDMRKMYPG